MKFSYDKYAVFREQKGLRDSDVAKIANIATATIYGWKHGNYQPKIDKLFEICRAVDAPISEIIENETNQ